MKSPKVGLFGVFFILWAGSVTWADWLDPAWPLRREVQVTAPVSSDTLHDYSVKLKLNDTNFDFDATRPDGNDLRVTLPDGITPVNFWLQEYNTPIRQGSLWVKMPTIAPNNGSSVYVYYGNAAASSASDGAATFPLFEDFNQSCTVTGPATLQNFSKMVYAPELPTPIIPLGAPGEFDHWGMREHGNVLVETSDPDTMRRYKTWYSALADSLYSDRTTWLAEATSYDGYHWTKLGRISLTARGEDPYVVHVGDTYYLYYEGKTAPVYDDVSVMTSPDGVNWTIYGTVIPPNPAFGWMDKSPSSPTVWVEYGPTDTTWYCYFEGKGATPGYGGGCIGLATSHDGINFSVYGTTPIIPFGNSGEWDSGAMVPDDILRCDGLYWLLYHGHNNVTPFLAGLATSTDLIHWTKVTGVSGNANAWPTADPQLFWDRDSSLVATMCTTGPTGQIYRGYLYGRNPAQWAFGQNWSFESHGGDYGLAQANGGALSLSGESFSRSSNSIISTQRWTNGFDLEVRCRAHDYGPNIYTTLAMGAGDPVDMNLGADGQWECTVLQSGYAAFIFNTAYMCRMPASGGKQNLVSWNPRPGLMSDYSVSRLVYDTQDSVKWYIADTLRMARKDTSFQNAPKRVLISQGEYPNGGGGIQDIDWAFVRPAAAREPTIQVGNEETHEWIQVLSPNGGEVVTPGQQIYVTWTGSISNSHVRIELDSDYPSLGWQTLDANALNSGQATVTIPSGTSSAHCRIRVTQIVHSVSDVSDNDFVSETVQIVSPNGGELFPVGQPIPVTWTSTDSSGTVEIDFDAAYPALSWQTLVVSTPNDGAETVSVPPGTSSPTCRIRVIQSPSGASDVSDNDFVIHTTQSVQVISPNGGEAYAAGQTINVTWTSSDSTSPIRVEFSGSYPSTAWQRLAEDSVNSGHESVIIPEGTASRNCRVRVTLIADSVSDVSDNDFVSEVIHVTSPNGGEVIPVGQPLTVTWSSTDSSGTVDIELNPSFPDSNWQTLVKGAPNIGYETVTIPAELASQTCRMRVIQTPTGASDLSDSNFVARIIQTVHVNTPNGGEAFAAGQPFDVTWTSSDTTSPVRIEFSATEPALTWQLLTEDSANTGHESVTIPAGVSSVQCRIRVTLIADSVSDESDDNFTSEVVHVIAPNGGEIVTVGQPLQVTWASTDSIGTVELDLNPSFPDSNWQMLVIGAPNIGHETMTIPAEFESQTCRMRVIQTRTGASDISDSNFTVEVIHTLHVVSPNGGESMSPGEPVSFVWTSSDSDGQVQIELNPNYPGDDWQTLLDSTTNDGQETLSIPPGISSPHCRVRITHLESGANDMSDNDFTVHLVLTVNVISPNGGEVYTPGQTIDIGWFSPDPASRVRVELNTSYPSLVWQLLAADTTNSGLETFPLPSRITSEHCRIRVSLIGDSVSDISDNDFLIMEAQTIDVVPSSYNVMNGCTAQFDLYVIASMVRVHVFDLNFTFPSQLTQVSSSLVSNHLGLYMMPLGVANDTLMVDGFYDGMFTGVDTLARLTFHFSSETDTTLNFRFYHGAGYTGASDSAVYFNFTGDTISIHIESTPLPGPTGLTLVPLGTDSLRLRWDAVTSDVDGDSVNNALYTIHFTDLHEGVDIDVAQTSGTTFIDSYWHGTPPNAVLSHTGEYTVSACRTQP